MKDINKLEHLQRWATKFILNDFISNYKIRLFKLKLLPLMYIFEHSDIIFSSNLSNVSLTALISYPFPTVLGQEVSSYMHHYLSNTNKLRQFYFVRICHLWNALPSIDITISIQTIKNKIKSPFWDHFTRFFDLLDFITYVLAASVSLC